MFSEIINLGYNCSATESVSQLENYKGRSPFDWVIINPKSLLKVLFYLYTFGPEETSRKYVSENKEISFFGIKSPHFTISDSEKLKRRIFRFHDSLKNKKEKILFTYVFPFSFSLCSVENFREEIEDIFNVLSLFRDQDTFTFCILHSEKEQRLKNVDEILMPFVPEEKFWVFPTIENLKIKYSLKQNKKGGWKYELR